MSGFSSVLPLPLSGGAAGMGTTLDHRQNNDDASLIHRVQRGDELAFREVVERFQTKVYSIIYGILRNRNDAEDIAQQVFTKVFFAIKRFDSRSALLTWIYKITVNECYDYLRKRRVRKLVYESDFSEEDAQRFARSEPAVDANPSVESNLASRDYVVKLLSKVSREDRSLLLLKEVEGHSVEELAEMTGMNQNTVKVRLFRARQKLLKAAHRLGRRPGQPAARPGD